MKGHSVALSFGSLASVATIPSANTKQITGTPGSPSAMMIIDGT
jgi:hypothetical protein